MELWMKVSSDKYEHPLIIADTLEELARKCGVQKRSIQTFMSHAKKEGRFCHYKRVIVEDEYER